MPEELDATQMDLTEHDDMTNRSNAPCFRRIDRLLWIFLSRWWRGWHENLVVVQPDTSRRRTKLAASEARRADASAASESVYVCLATSWKVAKYA